MGIFSFKKAESSNPFVRMRQKCNEGQVTFAKRIGMSVHTLRKWENGGMPKCINHFQRLLSVAKDKGESLDDYLK